MAQNVQAIQMVPLTPEPLAELQPLLTPEAAFPVDQSALANTNIDSALFSGRGNLISRKVQSMLGLTKCIHES